MIKCACGCETTFEQFDIKNRIRRFVSGHNSKICNPYKKELIKQICKTCGKEYFRNPSLANRGKNTYCSNKCRYKSILSWMCGKNHWNWKGGFGGVQNKRWCPEYNAWRKKVFKRDNYVCQECNEQMTYKNPLHAHHIIKFCDSLELAFDVDNGITLCKKCHIKIHRKFR